MEMNHFEPPQQSSKKSKQPKELRFITNHGAPHPKRRRVSAACMTCRKRKVACSGERPACSTCQQIKVECGGYDGSIRPVGSGKPQGGSNADDTAHGQTCIKPQRGAGQSLSQPDHRDSNEQTLAQSGRSNSTASRYSISSVEQESKLLSREQGSQADTAQPTRLSCIQEERSSNGSGTSGSLFSGPRNRMPYFRWLGPTAIMPGFKQMVVKVGRQDTINGVSSNHSAEGVCATSMRSPSIHRTGSVLSATPLPVEPDMRTPLTLPFYDTSSMPPSELITHLCNTFFTHLGCNFPFLQRERFLKDLEEKQVDAILVDAVCAMAARFSTHDLLTRQNGDGGKPSPSEYGSAFAQRAKEALLHTFATPNVAAVQAALLLAYNEFGESRDSGLWMYLGISIRLVQDLGLQKLDGLCYEGRDGPTPKMLKKNTQDQSVEIEERKEHAKSPPQDEKEAEEQRAVERERIDTFWAVFFLDRVVSSGTGRTCTLRDKDIELSFPSLETTDSKNGWPSPFPALIRIVHLYGRVSDLLNGIKEASDITEDTPQRLADMEARVTDFYQGLSPKLHFQAMNFHHYVKAGEGTNFVLLHFWFHTLIVLLHQPTLLKTFEGNMLQLFPNSQHISMSSAKTIADILSYSQLIDAKATLGNPFTTQPLYIAACAFLKESAEQTATSKEQSRAQSTVASRVASRAPSPEPTATADQSSRTTASTSTASTSSYPLPLTAADRLLARHTLLATAASQHYQLCYKALESTEVYWAGTKYILTVLDQKFKGVGDPLLYTAEEGEGSIEKPNPEAREAFRGAGWRRKIDWAGLGGSWLSGVGVNGMSNTAGINMGTGQGRGGNGAVRGEANDPGSAIGWTLTGTLNSPSTNLAWHFPSMHNYNQSTSYNHRNSSHQIDPLMPGFGFGMHESTLSPTTTLANSQHQKLDHSRMSTSGSSLRGNGNSLRGSSGRGSENMHLDPALRLASSPASATQRLGRRQQNSRLGRRSEGFDLNGFTIPTFSPPAPLNPPTAAGSINANTDTTTTAGVEVTGAAGDASMELDFGHGLGNDGTIDGQLGSVDGGLPMFGDMLIESQDVDTCLLGLDTLPWFEMEMPLPDDFDQQ